MKTKDFKIGNMYIAKSMKIFVCSKIDIERKFVVFNLTSGRMRFGLYECQLKSFKEYDC